MTFPIRIETERLILRPYEAGDLEGHVETLANWAVTQWLSTNVPFPYKKSDGETFIKEAQAKFAEGSSIRYAIEEKTTGRHVGGILIFAVTPETEVGYWMHPDFWGKGMGTEVLKAAISAGFDQGTITRFIAQTAQKNGGSQAILKKVGFQYAGQVPEEYNRDGHCEGCSEFFILERADWRAGQGVLKTKSATQTGKVR